MKRPLTRMKWRNEQIKDKKVEKELKRKAKAFLDYAMKNDIGYIDLAIFPGYVSCIAKKNSTDKDYIVNAHAFMEGFEIE